MYYADNPDVGTPSSGRLAGLAIWSRPLVFYTDSLWFRFISDQADAFGGFNLTWEASCRFCFVLFLNTFLLKHFFFVSFVFLCLCLCVCRVCVCVYVGVCMCFFFLYIFFLILRF